MQEVDVPESTNPGSAAEPDSGGYSYVAGAYPFFSSLFCAPDSRLQGLPNAISSSTISASATTLATCSGVPQHLACTRYAEQSLLLLAQLMPAAAAQYLMVSPPTWQVCLYLGVPGGVPQLCNLWRPRDCALCLHAPLQQPARMPGVPATRERCTCLPIAAAVRLLPCHKAGLPRMQTTAADVIRGLQAVR